MDAAEYHRTFLPAKFDRVRPPWWEYLIHQNPARIRGISGRTFDDGPLGRVRHLPQVQDGRNSYVRGDQLVPRVPQHRGLPGWDRYGLFAHNAYQRVRGRLHEIFVVQKHDQHFPDYMTEFEAQFSKLSPRHSAGALDPVVDEMFTVVGHLGTVNGQNIVIPEHATLPYGPLVDYIDKLVWNGVPVYVVARSVAVPGGLRPIGDDMQVTVLTRIDGEVLACLREKALGVEGEDPISWLPVVWGVAKLGAGIGKRIVKGLARKWEESLMFSGFVKLGTFKVAATELTPREVFLVERMAAKQTRNYVASSGLSRTTFEVSRQVAQEQGVVAIYRNTKPGAAMLGEMGCPAKDKPLEGITEGGVKGIQTLKDPADADKMYKLGRYVTNKDGEAVLITPDGKVKTLRLEPGEVKLWAGPNQVIDPVTKKPHVSDDDLMDVIIPARSNRWLALVVNNKQEVKNVINDEVKAYIEAVNPRLPNPRLMHAAQAQYAGIRGPCTAFLPDGSVIPLETEEEVRMFYKLMGRGVRTGEVRQPAGVVFPADEVGAMRERRRAGR